MFLSRHQTSSEVEVYNHYKELFISVINQLDAQNFCFTIRLFHACTCFEHHVLVIRSKLHYTASGIITPLSMMIPEAHTHTHTHT